jgi:hypothetical protein
MCLKALNPIGKESGYAIKIVTKTNKPDEFTSYYPVFHKEGDGGNKSKELHLRKTHRKSRVVYKIGRTYRVKHQFMARAENGDHYPALVHCYHNTNKARYNHVLNDETIILVKYSGGQYRDYHSLTAKYITPIAVLSGAILNKFIHMENNLGFDNAVESFLNAKFWLED